MIKNFFKILILLFILTKTIYPQDKIKNQIIELSEKFLNYLKSNNINQVKILIFNQVKFSKLSEKEIISLGEDVLAEKIPVSEYIIKITGNNLFNLFSGEISIVEYEINSKEMGTEKVINKDKFLKEDFYYIKGRAKFKQKDKTINDKEFEIDILRDEKNELKIFGFIF
jgi:hypothetical protein